MLQACVVGSMCSLPPGDSALLANCTGGRVEGLFAAVDGGGAGASPCTRLVDEAPRVFGLCCRGLAALGSLNGRFESARLSRSRQGAFRSHLVVLHARISRWLARRPSGFSGRMPGRATSRPGHGGAIGWAIGTLGCHLEASRWSATQGL